MIELKPCPFCGGKAEWCGDLPDPKGCGDALCDHITCNECDYNLALNDSTRLEGRVLAMETWNTRPSDKLARVRAEIEERSKHVCDGLREQELKQALRMIDRITKD